MDNVTEYVYDVRDRPMQSIQPVADPAASPSVTTKDDSEGTFNLGSWSQTCAAARSTAMSMRPAEMAGKATYSFSGLNADKKYAVQVRWTPSTNPTEYDTNALFEVFGNTGVDPLHSMRANLNRKPEGLAHGAGLMWLSLGAFLAIQQHSHRHAP